MELDQRPLEELKILRSRTSEPLLNRLIDLYKVQAPRLLGELKEGFSAGNSEVVSNCAHTLKSSSAQLGAIDFSESCKVIELTAKQGTDQEVLPDLIATADEQLPQVLELLDAARV